VTAILDLAVPPITFLLLFAVGLDLAPAILRAFVGSRACLPLGFGGGSGSILLIVASDPVGFLQGRRGTVPLAATFLIASLLAG
jgi:hypothetical protein